MFNIPSLKGEAKGEYKVLKKITDSKNFAPFTNKTDTIGRVLQKTYAIICDGKGDVYFVQLGSKTLNFLEKLKGLQELKQTFDTGALTKEEYEEIRKAIVEGLKKSF